MSLNSFVHLHAASSFSLRYGTAAPEALVAQAVAHGQQALALTDRDSVAGTIRFTQACQDAGIAPILGADLTIALERAPRVTPMHGGTWLHQVQPRVTVLAQNQKSWAGLCKTLSVAHATEQRFAQIEQSQLMELASKYELQVLLGPESMLGWHIAQRKFDQATDYLNQWRAHGVTPVIEIVTHRAKPNGMQLSDVFAARMLQWAIAQKVPAVLTNMARYLTPEQARIADVLDAARAQVPLSEKNRQSSTNQAFLADSEHMNNTAYRIANMVGDPRDIARSLLQQTHDLAQQSAIDPKTELGLGSVYVPELSMVTERIDLSAIQLLRAQCDQGISDYLQRQPQRRVEANNRLEVELDVLTRMGLAGYILTITKVVDMIRNMGIRVAARGSGAGSFVNHILGIAGVDPLEHNLLMERFVSTLRPGLPDVDIDVESHRRLEVYDAIFAEFGNERVACVAMYETYRVRNAIRDVGAALGMPQGEIGSLAKSFPHIKAKHVRSALAELPELRRSGLAVRASRGELDQFLDLVEGLDSLPRQVAMHPCGIVLSDSSLLNRTPVQASAQGYSMTPFDKDDVEAMGLLKLDVLGVRMQSALSYAVAEVSRVRAQVVETKVNDSQVSDLAVSEEKETIEPINLEKIPLDDPETFALIQSTKTLGCFQIESPGQRELIGKYEPKTFHDLIVDISLFRPGPVKSDMIGPFLRARQGWEAARYLHPDLAPILQETYGVVVFHEQVMRIVATMTGCSLEYADLVRRNLGDFRKLDEIREWFYASLRKRGYTLKIIEDVWEVLRAFASFGFCKAHGAAFALPTYQSAWLKTHHPAEFFAGVLTHDPGMYPKRLIVDDARSCGVAILGLDVNASKANYVVEIVAPSEVNTQTGTVEPATTLGKPKYGVRVALNEVKGINANEVSSIIAGQPYRSLYDFLYRAGVSQPIAQRLILAGGFDELHAGQASRNDLLFHAMDVLSAPNAVKQGSTQFAFFDEEVWQPEKTGLKPMTLADRVKNEVEILGIDVSAHVVSFYIPMLRDLGVLPSSRLLDVRSQSNVLVAGVKVSTQTPPIRTGKRVVFVTLDDSTGPIDIAFFDEAQQHYASTLFHSWLVLIRGTTRRTGPRGVSVQANGCWELATVYEHWRNGGSAAVHELLNQRPYDGDETPPSSQVWEHASGFKHSLFSDVTPAGVSGSRIENRSAGVVG
jgi:error-prone DNA polymerase